MYLRIPSLCFVATALSVCCVRMECMQSVINLPQDAEGTGHYIAVLKEDTSHARLLEIVEELRHNYRVYNYVEVAMKAIFLDIPSEDLQEIHSKFKEIDYFEEEGISYGHQISSENGSYYDDSVSCVPESFSDSSRYCGGDIWYQKHINQLPNEGEGVDVYILDTGIRFDHHEFEYRAKYVGYDPVDNYEYYKLGVGDLDYVPMRGADCHGHGTAVASLVGGRTFGKAKKANLYSVRVIRCDTSAPWRIILDGMNYVAKIASKGSNNAIILLALSSVPSESIDHMIMWLSGWNIMVITAAGNNGIDACEASPASSPYAMTVGATDRDDKIAVKSNYGPCVDLFAPGEGILAASNECDSCTNMMSGSTMSAAITAGVVTAYFSRSPHFTPAQVKEKFLEISIPDIIDLSSIPTDTLQSQTPNQLLSAGCGGEIIVYFNEGVLESPNFPGYYPPNLRCKWTLMSVSCTGHIIVNFTHILLEEHYDKLKVCVKDVCDEDDKLVLTGDYGGRPDCILQSDGRYMTIEIATDGFTGGSGFRATHIAIKEPTTWIKGEKCEGDDLNSIMQLDVYSVGKDLGRRFSIKIGWKEIYAGIHAGIHIVVIDKVNGSVISKEDFSTYYNAYPSQNNDNMRLMNYIREIPFGAIVCVAVSYDGVSQLIRVAKNELMLLGSSLISDNVKPFGSWALIGAKGTRPGQAIEVASSDSPAHVWARVHLKQYRQPIFEITAESAGTASGNYARITVNGTEVNVPYVNDGSGLHVVVINSVTGLIIISSVFDTSATSKETVPTPSEDFANLIEFLPSGTIVVIAVKNDGITHLSEDAKRACERIGSDLIRRVKPGESWAIIGRKGARNGSVPESYSDSTVSKSILILPTSSNETCRISMQSLSIDGVNNTISVTTGYNNMISHARSTTEGNMVAVLRDGECSIESYFTSITPGNIINEIENDRVVLVNMAYKYRSVSEAGLDALKSIGSSGVSRHVKSWAIIGKKGAQRGSITEVLFKEKPKTLSLEKSIDLDEIGASIPFRENYVMMSSN